MSQNVDGLIRDALLGEISTDLKRQGFPSLSVFYSNPYATLKKGDYYIAGLNPGGAEKPKNGKEEYDWIKDKWGSNPRSSYLIEDDEDWGTNFQPNMKRFAVCWLQDYRNLRDIFSSNAIFARSPRVDSLNENARGLFEVCWPWHQRFLDLVRPRIIIAISNDERKPSAFHLFHDRLQNSSLDEPRSISRKFSIKRSRGILDLPSGQLEVRLIGLPHLSYCNVAARPDIIKELKETGWL